MNGTVETYKNQAIALFAQGDFAAAEVFCRSAVIAAPDDATTHYNLGVVLAKREHYEQAIACYRKTIELNPAFAPAYTNIGFCLNAYNLIERAREAFAIARILEPNNPVPVLNEGIAALALGDYAAGWRDFAARWDLPSYAKFKRVFDKPVWKGENLSGKRLFLYSEQGFGDTLQMARFIPVLAAQGATVIAEVQPALVELLRSLQDVSQVIAQGETSPDFDFYGAMMDVPLALGTTVATIPADTPYLFSDMTQKEFYQKKSLAKAVMRVGLCWAGRASHENDHNRSLKFSQLAPLLEYENIEWVSLQRLVPPADAPLLADSSVLDWGQSFSDFSATAAAIMKCDLVLTVDTAVAHLAGALGKNVWVLLSFYADWRWLTERTDSPWYPTARLFRQKRRGAWDEVIEETRCELEKIRT